jgi:soluble lytic murein transglycosylase-like protein
MQFLQSTFDGVVARHPLPAGGASPPSRYDPHDAIYAAAYYLCDNGAGRGNVDAAIFAYNHANW